MNNGPDMGGARTRCVQFGLLHARRTRYWNNIKIHEIKLDESLLDA